MMDDQLISWYTYKHRNYSVCHPTLIVKIGGILPMVCIMLTIYNNQYLEK